MDEIKAMGGVDTVEGFDGDDTMFCGTGDDWLIGCGGSDVIYAGDGDNQIREKWYMGGQP